MHWVGVTQGFWGQREAVGVRPGQAGEDTRSVPKGTGPGKALSSEVNLDHHQWRRCFLSYFSSQTCLQVAVT